MNNELIQISGKRVELTETLTKFITNKQEILWIPTYLLQKEKKKFFIPKWLFNIYIKNKRDREYQKSFKLFSDFSGMQENEVIR